jgi:hypothetical protein
MWMCSGETVWHSPAEHFLVGDFAWLGPTQVFWFAANGDSTADEHVLEFEQVEQKDDGLHFFAGGRRVGLLSAIEEAAVEDPDDFRIAWQIWQQIAPLRGGLLERARHQCAAHTGATTTD